MFSKNFATLESTFNIGRHADAIANLAKEKIAEDGDFAKLHASVVLSWMEEIIEQADKALALQLDNENK